jgi:long-subunit fatty acid transport protein
VILRCAVAVLALGAGATAFAQDQQLGARTKAMGGSYTAFEDDPVSIWLNPAGIATQPTQAAIAYQTYTTYPLHEEPILGTTESKFSAGPEMSLVDPVMLPSYLGFVFSLGKSDSPMAFGFCYARPYHLSYSFAKVTDPANQTLTAENSSNMEESLSRIRFAFAKDFRLKPKGEKGYFTHLSVGLGLDIGYEQWRFTSAEDSRSDSATAIAGGAGVLLGVYDNADDLRVNFGAAYQTFVRWEFNVDPALLPVFNMPQQANVGVTVYMLKGLPLRATLDFQWIEWKDTAARPFFANQPSFRNVFNYSIGFEYRIDLNDEVNLLPRIGYRRFNAPWQDPDNLPMVGRYKLLVDTKAASFNIITFGFGLTWFSDGGKARTVDIGADVNGDVPSVALGFNYEF